MENVDRRTFSTYESAQAHLFPWVVRIQFWVGGGVLQQIYWIFGVLRMKGREGSNFRRFGVDVISLDRNLRIFVMLLIDLIDAMSCLFIRYGFVDMSVDQSSGTQRIQRLWLQGLSLTSSGSHFLFYLNISDYEV